MAAEAHFGMEVANVSIDGSNWSPDQSWFNSFYGSKCINIQMVQMKSFFIIQFQIYVLC